MMTRMILAVASLVAAGALAAPASREAEESWPADETRYAARVEDGAAVFDLEDGNEVVVRPDAEKLKRLGAPSADNYARELALKLRSRQRAGRGAGDWGKCEIALRPEAVVPLSSVATIEVRKARPAAASRGASETMTWSDASGGLRGRLDVSRCMAPRLPLQGAVYVENVSEGNLAVDMAPLRLAGRWRVMDANGKGVELPLAAAAQPAGKADWRVLIAQQQFGTIVSLPGPEAPWRLKPGSYTLHYLLKGSGGEAVNGAAAWKGRVELPPVQVEVFGEVDEAALKAAVAKVRKAHPPGGAAMYKALAELVHPGMTVDQMKLALPPQAQPVGVGAMPHFWLWNGSGFYLTYPLDAEHTVKASGVGTKGRPGEEAVVPVLTSRPRIEGRRAGAGVGGGAWGLPAAAAARYAYHDWRGQWLPSN